MSVDKKKNNRVVVGISLTEDAAQISCQRMDAQNPETISQVVGEEEYNIPLVLCRRFEVNQWYHGKIALKKADEGEGTLVANILSRALKQEQVLIEKDEFLAVDLLALFVKKIFQMALNSYPMEQIEAVMLCVQRLDLGALDALERVATILGPERQRIHFCSYAESYYAYMIHQSKELWAQKVLLCDCNRQGLSTYLLEVSRRTNPNVVFVEEREFPRIRMGELPADTYQRTKEMNRRDKEFLEIMQGVCEGTIITSVYLIGDGFSKEWSKESLPYLCRNRRVFQGNNLFSKGATYLAYAKVDKDPLTERYVYLGSDKWKVNVGMHVIRRGLEVYMALLDAGYNWYELRKECDLIIEQGNKITILVTPLNGMGVQALDIMLDDFPKRPAKASRIRMLVEPVTETSLRVTIKDLGFGEFFPSSQKSWVEEIDIQHHLSGLA